MQLNLYYNIMKRYEIGHKFSRLTLLEKISSPGKDGKSKTYYRCLCDCGNEIIRLSTNINGGNTKSCGCLRVEACIARERKKNHPTHGHILSYYKRNAKMRNLSWELTEDRFTELIKSPCEYCGLEPERRILRGKEIYFNGIDRKDSSKNYTNDNVVSCCAQCNWAKNKFTLEEFTMWVSRVYLHLNGGGAHV